MSHCQSLATVEDSDESLLVSGLPPTALPLDLLSHLDRQVKVEVENDGVKK